MGFLKKLSLFVSAILLFVSCSSDDSQNQVQQKIKVVLNVEDKTGFVKDYSVLKYDIYNQDTGRNLTGNLAKSGVVTLELEVGNYDFKVENPDIGYALKPNVVVDKAMTLNLDIQLIEPSSTGLVISELFTSGYSAKDEYGQYVELGDQYVVITNNSQSVKYLDGVSYAITEHWNKFPYNTTTKDALSNNQVMAALVYTFPGTGRDYPLAPGEDIVLARSAKDFSDGGKNELAADLSGVDFEIVMPERDTDNPNAANMIINGTTHADMLGYGTGFSSAFLFKHQGNLKAFLNKNTVVVESMYGSKPAFTISEDLIIDGVETGQVSQVKYKSLLNKVDRGFITVSDTGTREVYRRKVKQINNQVKVYQDTNNSTEDFTVSVGQSSFPG